MKIQAIAKYALLIGLGLAACQPVQAMPAAQAAAKSDQCSVATLKGRYLFAFNGHAVPPAFGVTEMTSAGSAGFHVFNGDGTGQDIVTVRIDGKTLLQKVTVPITYKVDADCTGSYTVDIENGPTFDIFVDPSGEKLAVIATDPGNGVSTIDVKVGSK